MKRLLTVTAFVFPAFFLALALADDYTAPVPEALKPSLSISWRLGPDYPMNSGDTNRY